MALFGGVQLPERPDPANIAVLDRLPTRMLGRMMRFGFRIDIPYTQELSSQFCARMTELRRDITGQIPASALDRFVEPEDAEDSEDAEIPTVPPEFQVDSADQTADLLYNVLGLDKTSIKVKKTKGGQRLSTGKKTLEQLKREHPIVPLILKYREYSKLESTYLRSMPRHAKYHPKGADCPVCGRYHYTEEYRVHTTIVSTRTATGRTASRNPNLANIPTRTKEGALVRASFIPSDGYVISQRDFAQIELRLLADRSGDAVMIQVYLNDGDIHIETAMRTFHITDPAKIDKLLHRAPSKNTNFAVAYLITGAGLLDLMAVTFATAGVPMPDYMTEQWCDEFIRSWFGVYKGVRIYLDAEESKAFRYRMVWTACGRVRLIPQVRSCHKWIAQAGVREACNTGIQGYSADIMKLAMGELDHRLDILERVCGVVSYPLQTIYDELLIETPEDHGETIQAAMGDIMDNVLVDKQSGKLLARVPIQSDGKLLTRWTKE